MQQRPRHRCHEAQQQESPGMLSGAAKHNSCRERHRRCGWLQVGAGLRLGAARPLCAAWHPRWQPPTRQLHHGRKAGACARNNSSRSSNVCATQIHWSNPSRPCLAGARPGFHDPSWTTTATGAKAGAAAAGHRHARDDAAAGPLLHKQLRTHHHTLAEHPPGSGHCPQLRTQCLEPKFPPLQLNECRPLWAI